MSPLKLATVLLLGLAVVQVQHAGAEPTAAPTASSSATIPPLQPIQRLPDGCGAVAQVVEGYTSCQDFAGWAGITLASFVELNPLVAPQCDTAHGGQGLQVGNAACIGDTIAFCSNVYTATSADTCHSIAKTEGAIVNIDGAKDTSCRQLARSAGVPVCVNKQLDKCRKDTICGLSISTDLQEMLAAQPDFCDILSECKADPELTTFDDKPSLAMTISEQTSAVQQATASGANPPLTSLTELQKTVPAAALRITLTPKWFTDEEESGMTRFEFGELAAATRKLLAVWRPTPYRPRGFMRVPPRIYY